jgi:translation initiation factor IF-3
MDKPKLMDFLETVYQKGKPVAVGLNFAKYAFALEKYIHELEKKVK